MDAAGAPTPRSILRIERRHCPHCSQFISLKTYRAHKRLYYDPDVCVWQTSTSYSLALESPPRCGREDEELTVDTFPSAPPVDMGGTFHLPVPN